MLPSHFHAFRPRLLDALRGYDRHCFAKDLGAGITVGIVALPLAMAFAIASGVKPEQGIFTAIIAGLLISALGGSQVQIGGPAGAFIVIVYGIVQRYGLANLLIATALAGVLMFVLGWFKLGALVRYIPISIVVGFTNGIAVLIALSQLKDLLGLSVGNVSADFAAQVEALVQHIDGLNLHALALGLLCLAGLFVWPLLFTPGKLRPATLLERAPLRVASRIPGTIVALVTLSLLAAWLHWPVETIGSRFGGIPRSLPDFVWPDFSWSSVQQLFIPTITIAMLGAIESLLCARVADNLATFKPHDPNQELMAQGVANFVVPFFGGIPATGTIARTVTNLRAGAVSPIAGLLHAATLLVIVLVAAPLAAAIPLSVLAGVLLYVAWNMGEWSAFRRLGRHALEYRTKLLATFLLTVIVDLTVAVQVGLVLACVFFIYRMSTLFQVETDPVVHDGVKVAHLYGSLFFGAVGKLEAIGESIAPGTRAVVLEMHQLVSVDSTGLAALEQLHRVLRRSGVRLLLCAINAQPLQQMRRAELDAHLGPENLLPDLASALALVARPAASVPEAR